MKIKNILKKTIVYTVLIIIALFFIITGPYLWNNLITYPRLEQERLDIWTKYKQPEIFIKQNEYKGVFHMHSYWSHDSRGSLDEILSAAKKAEYDFLFFADHAHSKLDTFPRSYHGNYDGIIFESGTENSNGFMVTPMDTVVLDWKIGDFEVIRDVVRNDGLVIYVHTEDTHDWLNQDYQAMEIYNIHTDYLDGKDSFNSIILNLLFNKTKYHHWVFREMYDEQTDIISNWDRLNRDRKIVGVAGVDAHNNQSYRARYIDDGNVEWIGPNAKTVDISEPGIRESILLSEQNENGWAFKWEVDPYFISFNHVANHVFSDTFNNYGIKNNLVSGHSFIAFQSLAKADGFQFFAVDDNNNLNAIMGDSISVKSVSKLRAVSPFPANFEIVRDGETIHSIEHVYNMEYILNKEGGNYRIVAKLFLDNSWISWVFTNPIYVYSET